MKDKRLELSKLLFASFYMAPALTAQAMSLQAKAVQNSPNPDNTLFFEKIQKVEDLGASAGGIKAKKLPPVSLEGKTLDEVVASARSAGYDVEVLPA